MVHLWSIFGYIWSICGPSLVHLWANFGAVFVDAFLIHFIQTISSKNVYRSGLGMAVSPHLRMDCTHQCLLKQIVILSRRHGERFHHAFCLWVICASRQLCGCTIYKCVFVFFKYNPQGPWAEVLHYAYRTTWVQVR